VNGAGPDGVQDATDTAGRLLIVSSIRWGFLWQRHQALATAAAADGWEVDFLQPRPRTIRQIATFPFRVLHRHVVAQDHGPPPPGVTILGPRHWLRPRGRPPYDLALVYIPDRLSEAFLRRNRARRVVYDAVLDWSAVPASWFPPLGWRSSERRIAGWPNARLTTDAEGMAAVLAGRGYAAQVIPPAADDAFLTLPSLTFEERRRRALYFGAVRPEVHVTALVALRAHGVEVDVVGPVTDAALRAELERGGVTVRDPLPVGDLAELAASYRVTVLPYRGERAATLMPAKFWNCVASGAWVVCLGLDTPRLPTVRATTTTQEFVAAVVDALETPVQERAAPPTWGLRWQALLAAGEWPGGTPGVTGRARSR